MVPPGKHELTVNMVRDEATQVVFASGGELEIKQDAPSQIEITMPVVNCLFIKPEKVIASADEGRDLASFNTVEELFEDLEN
jgi:hypothetical protein